MKPKTPAPDTSGVHVWLVLMKAHAALAKHAQRNIDALNLGESEFRALEVLLHKGPLPVNTIGPKVSLTTGAISVAVDRLVNKGLVRRREGQDDRRVRVVELTAKGQKIIARGFDQHAEAMESACVGLNKTERQSLIRLLKKLGKAFEERVHSER